MPASFRLEAAPSLAPLALTFSPDERWLAYGLHDPQAPHLVRLEDPDTEPIHLQSGGGRCVLAFSGDSKRLWSGSQRRHGVWQMDTLQSTSEKLQDLADIAFNAQGERIAASTRSLIQLRLVDLPSGREQVLLASEEGSTEPLSPPQFSPDGQRLMAGTQSSGDAPMRLRVWDSGSGQLAYDRQGGTGRFFFQGLNPVTLASPASLAITELTTDRQQESVSPRGRPPYAEYGFLSRFFFSDSGQLCAETGLNGELAIWDFSRPQRIPRVCIERIRRRPSSLSGQDLKAFSRDGSKLAALDGPSLLKVWDTHTGQVLGQLDLKSQPHRFVFGPDDQELWLIHLGQAVLSWRPGQAQIRSLGTLQTDPQLEQERKAGLWSSSHLLIEDAVRITHDRKHLFFISRPTGASFHTLYTWDLPEGRLATRQLPLIADSWPRLAVNNDGSKLALLGSVSVLKVLNLDSHEEYFQFEATTPKTLRLSRAATSCALGEEKGESAAVRVFDLSRKAQIFTTTLPHRVSCLALADDGTSLAVAQDKQTFVYDLRTGKQTVFSGHESEITDLAFANRAHLLASASARDGTVRLWDLATGNLLATLPAEQESLSRVDLSPTGRWLATLDFKGQVRLWDLTAVRRSLQEAGLDW
jgi:WD40 repeat protein